MIRFVLIWLAALFTSGIVLARYISVPLNFLFVLFLFIFIASLILLKLQRINSFDISLSILFILLGAIAYRVAEFRAPSDIQRFIDTSKNRNVYIEGYVISLPQVLKAGSKFLLRPQQLSLGNKAYQGLRGNIKVYLPLPKVNYGDYLGITGRFKKYSSGNLYLKVSSSEKIEKIKQSHLNIIKYLSYKMNEGIRRLFFEKFPVKQASFLSAFILGRREFLTLRDYLPFKRVGTMHLLAISGLHTGIVLGIFNFILRFFGLKRRARLPILLLLIPFWIFFTGIKPPVVRAGLLSAFWIITFFLQRKQYLLHNIFLSGFLVLLFRPQQIFNVSFQLSYLCVLFIALFYPYIFKAGVKWRILREGFFISLVVWLGTFPIVSYYFGYISFLSILANIILIPLVFTIIVLVFLYLLTSPSILGEAFYFSTSFILLLFLGINKFFSSLAFACVRVRFPLGLVFSYYLCLGLFLILYKAIKDLRRRKKDALLI